MNAKWYLSTLFIILGLLGVSLQQFSVPNQEIVVQFVDKDFSIDEAQDAVAIVKKQLQSIGVDQVKVLEGKNGVLKISYYSDVDIASIKKIFSEDIQLAFDFQSSNQTENHSNLPSDSNSNSFKLDVFEIQNSIDVELDLNGLALNFNPEKDRLVFLKVYFSRNDIDVAKKDNTDKVAYTIFKKNALTIDDAERTIPEVRAGPIV